MEDIIGRAAREALGDTKRRCTATNRSGEQCNNYPSPGAFVCRLHGGKTPLAQRAAKERLLMLVEPALEVLYRATRNAPPCEHCGRSDADRDPTALRAAGMILDRTGFQAGIDVHVHTVPPEFEGRTNAEIAAWARALADELDAMDRYERGPQLLLPKGDTIDVDVVEDTSPDTEPTT